MRLKGRSLEKNSGILLGVASLPSRYGIGSLGKEAFRFLDFLKKTNQSYWQILPLCPIGKGNSPYYSIGSCAGETLLIDIDKLVDLGLIFEDEIPETEFPKNINYSLVREFKLPLLKKAVKRFNTRLTSFKEFKAENSYWLEDFALFAAIKESFSGKLFTLWEDGLKYRLPEALENFRREHKREIEYYEITQFLFYMQYNELKQYAEANGIKIIGDIPFYVSLDSSDVWSNPECFLLDRKLTPIKVAGVPPDIFSDEGQLWGNPVYNLKEEKEMVFAWWKNRILHNAKMFHAIRMDHFRAFADYYTVDYGAPNAIKGSWEKGMDMEFWNRVIPNLKNTEIIAEDLGGDTPEVKKLIKNTGFPNMKVLQFGFSSDLSNDFLPRNFEYNCICYTGTHDNDTAVGWYKNASKKERLLFSRLTLNEPYPSNAMKMISMGMKSPAKTVIIPIQDYMELDSSHRLNIPGTPEGNWEWRLDKDYCSDELIEKVKELSSLRKIP